MNEIKNVLFVGSVYPNNREAEIKRNSNHGIDNAANNLQAALLVGLDKYYPDIKVITQPVIRTFPFGYKKIIFKGSNFGHKNGAKDFCLGFLNVIVLKHISKYLTLLVKLLDIVNVKHETVIIIYGVHSPYLMAISTLRLFKPNVKVCLIAPDLPQFMSENKNIVFKFLKFIDFVFIKKYMARVDSFVILSEFMKEPLEIDHRPWTLIEGIYNKSEVIDDFDKERFKTILYTGSVGIRYGILNLLNAFDSIKDANYRLWIRGDGDAKKYIIDASKLDSRITYFEEMSRNELMLLQKRATVLINPVTSNEPFTRFFFPSKTMDYLASGTPTIMNYIESLPKEYLDYVYVPQNENIDGLKEMILTVCNKNQTELNEFGRKASKFILENKNPIVQVKKIYDMINTL